MDKATKNAIIKKITPNVFLKKVLSYPYENIGLSRVFHLENPIDIEQVCAMKKVLVCENVDMLKASLESSTPVNVYVSKNLVNRVLLEELLNASAQSKNIFWGIA